jgi:chemotaxis protein methyltransferase CheR
MADPREYIARLREDHDERTELLDAFSIYHSQFIRDPMKYQVFKDTIIPDIFTKNRERWNLAFARPGIAMPWHKSSFRIWSAGCAGGEEPYSIAMMLLEVLGEQQARWNILIQATDINRTLIEKARRGIYKEEEIIKKGVPAEFVEKYFEKPEPGYLAVKSQVKKMVNFAVSDLLTDRAMGGTDVIFCRNVLIYFGVDAVRRIALNFHASLNPGGYLLLGNSEYLDDHFICLYHKLKSNGEYFYQKITEGTPEYQEALERWKNIMGGLGIQHDK